MSDTPTTDQFVAHVEAHAYGEATPEQLAVLEADKLRWRTTLVHLIEDTENTLAELEASSDDSRFQAIADFETELRHLLSAYARLTGDVTVLNIDPNQAGLGHPATIMLQLSWEPGKVIAWAAGPMVGAVGADRVAELLGQAGASASGWSKHPSIRLADGTIAEALSIPASEVLGWLVSLGGPEPSPLVGPSGRWLGQVAVWAVDLAARGAMVPLLRQRRRNKKQHNPNLGAFSVRWTPALVDPERLELFAETMPGAATAASPSTDGKEVVKSALTGMIDAICRTAAAMVEVPAPPPEVRNARDTAETFLARLDGSHFEAPPPAGNELVGRLDRWARPIVNGNPNRLILQLDPPDESNAWHLIVLAEDPDGLLVSVEVALVNAGPQRREIEDQLVRLERLLPVLLRPGSNRRGEVMLSQDEAWDLMSRTGPELAMSGYDVRVPAMSTRKATPALRLTAESSTSVVGANQLANVRWSAVFGDVELTAEEINRLAKEARPLVRSGGKWVAIDHADLAQAAAALAERSRKTQLTGAEMLRHALGLEGSQLPGGVSLAGSSWATDLLAAARSISDAEIDTPRDFDGELRSYQREALGWLGFLNDAGLGGCLALDMGLGKTPTMLSHLVQTRESGPALVIAPPAVIGNWASEAHKFTPKLKIAIHHGPNRAVGEQIEQLVALNDVVITTYGTAVRDIADLERIDWARVVLDEAQAIKNPANETSQQLRRLKARCKVALTGTPIENGLGDLWSILDFTNPGLIGPRNAFIAQLSAGGGNAKTTGEDALRALNGILVFRRTKAEPAIAAELPDRVDTLDHCSMTPEQIGLYQAVLDRLLKSDADGEHRKGEVLAAITALKQICNHPAAYQDDGKPLTGRSGKLARLEEIVHSVFSAGEKVLIFTHFAEWGVRMADHLTQLTGRRVHCYHGGLSRTVRDEMIREFQTSEGPGALVLSLKAGGTGLNLTAASHVVLYDRWWNPAVEDQARDRAWRIGQTKTVICHRLVCPGTVDEKVEEVVNDKRRIADLVLPKSSSLADLDADQLRMALGLRPEAIVSDAGELTEEAQLVVGGARQ